MRWIVGEGCDRPQDRQPPETVGGIGNGISVLRSRFLPGIPRIPAPVPRPPTGIHRIGQRHPAPAAPRRARAVQRPDPSPAVRRSARPAARRRAPRAERRPAARPRPPAAARPAGSACPGKVRLHVLHHDRRGAVALDDVAHPHDARTVKLRRHLRLAPDPLGQMRPLLRARALLGEAGMGRVRQARKETLRRDVALKLMRLPERDGSPARSTRSTAATAEVGDGERGGDQDEEDQRSGHHSGAVVVRHAVRRGGGVQVRCA